MKFRTEYVPQKSSIILLPHLPVVLAGSCFSQNIAVKMHQHGWEAVNPFGTLYNPLSIVLAIDLMCDTADGERRFDDTLFQYSGIWHSHLFDSSLSSLCREDCMEEFRHRQVNFQKAMEQGETLIVTFGTAICYFLNNGKYPVGNCHKQPAHLYSRRRIDVEEICELWMPFLKKLKLRYPGLKVVFTVSPVRHLKDGFEGSSRSKAVLLLSIDRICENLEFCEYFPAYEIQNDDLRGYRFYGADLVHPSDEAVDYIWEKFVATYIDHAGEKKLQEGLAAYKRFHHRPMTGALDKPLQEQATGS